LADSFVLRDGAVENVFWVLSYFSTAAAIRERLEAYVIADDVVIDDFTAAWAGVAIIGADTVRGLETRQGPGFRFRGRRTREENFDWIFPVGEMAGVRAGLEQAGVRELSALELEQRRLAAGIPAVPRDIGPCELPNEGGLEADAISYTKGCYLGQEVMARLKSLGQVRRRLTRVTGDGETFPALPAALFSVGRKVGELRSAAPDGSGGFLGLALLSLLHLPADALLSFTPESPPRLRVIATP
jgi:folate-binding protein YgfZ